ncbi:MAG TPA: polysaccharide deacetylase family protein, partial [Planctomycetota bacterium]|nr:polysaccharide deacetylase family protein [Planctomycetota bacterium]
DGAAAWEPLRARPSRAELAGILEVLGRRYRVVPLAAAVEMLAGRRPVEPYSLAITFDDGYRNNVTHALPVLRRFGAPATIFLATGKLDARATFAFDRLDYALQQGPGARDRAAVAAAFSEQRSALKGRLGADLESGRELEEIVARREAEVGRTLRELGEAEPWTALLTWEEVERHAADPLLEFGSHTVDHVRLGLADAATARDQVRRSKEAIERRTGRPCAQFAYPNGSFSPAAVAAVREAGYTCAVTTEDGINAPGADPLALRRIGIPLGASATEILAVASGLSAAIAALKARLTGKATS